MGKDGASELTKESLGALMLRARIALRTSQDDVASQAGVSKRTVRRWEAGQSTPLPAVFGQFGGLLLPIDSQLGEELIQRGRALAASLGFPFTEPARPARPPPPAAEPSTQLTAPRQETLAVASPKAVETKPIEMRHLVDAVVCAASDQGELLPRALRPILLAAFTRAEELGLEIAEVRRALEPKRSGRGR